MSRLCQMIADATGLPISSNTTPKPQPSASSIPARAQPAARAIWPISSSAPAWAQPIIIDGQLFRGRMTRLARSAMSPSIATVCTGLLRRAGQRRIVLQRAVSGDAIFERRGEPWRPTVTTQRRVDGAAGRARRRARARCDRRCRRRAGRRHDIIAMLMDIDLYVIGGSVAKAGERCLRPLARRCTKYCFHMSPNASRSSKRRNARERRDPRLRMAGA